MWHALVAVIVLVAVVAGCGSTPQLSPSPSLDPPATLVSTPTFTATIGRPTPTASPSPTPIPVSPAHTVTSDDGMLTIDVPAGTLPVGVNLTATAQGEDGLPPELLGMDVRSAFYRLQPDVAVFASPVTITRRVSLEDLGLDLEVDGLPVLALAMRSVDGSWEWLDDQRLTADGATGDGATGDGATGDGAFVVASGTATHASHVFAFGGTTFTRFSLDGESPTPIGSSVTLNATLIFPDDPEDPPTLGGEFEPVVGSSIVALGSGSRPDDGSLSQDFRCVRDGTSFMGVRYAVLNIGAASVLFGQLGLGPVATEVTVGSAMTCLNPATPSPAASPSPSTSPSPSGAPLTPWPRLPQFPHGASNGHLAPVQARFQRLFARQFRRTEWAAKQRPHLRPGWPVLPRLGITAG